VSIYVVRHGHAGSRERWPGDDTDRPLSPKGRSQARAIDWALDHVEIHRVLTSPALRCRQTVEQLAERHGVEPEITDRLAEGAGVARAVALLRELAAGPAASVVCSHGDVIPAVLDALRSDGVPLHGTRCTKGSIWLLETEGQRIVSATYLDRPVPAAADGP
jgi:8-oxo-(d)GTP phosphatase